MVLMLTMKILAVLLTPTAGWLTRMDSLGTFMSRREALLQPGVSAFFLSSLLPNSSSNPVETSSLDYSTEWAGTSLTVMSLDDAVASASDDGWSMARWPDPVLRRRASEVSSRYFGTALLERACQLLRTTAIREKAVGLAAEQCGVDARIIYLERAENNPLAPSLVLVNPRITGRSSEIDMKVWREHCLVLPPTFSATVLRDAWVDVHYQELKRGEWRRIRLQGEAARAFQHEFDHDRGILITDHIGLDEMDNDVMAAIERKGHELRMGIAYSRDVQVSPMLTRAER
jgi:peptide deformylase